MLVTDLRVGGMHGLGDNIHQRAIVRQLIGRGYRVWLETPWPSVYHDLRGDMLRIVGKGSILRTQAKNSEREQALDRYDNDNCPRGIKRIQISYSPDMVRKHRGVLQAMSAHCGVPVGDFALPINQGWHHGLSLPENKRILIVRPLTDRTEWGGCKARNPDISSYLEIYKTIRPYYYCISLADLEPKKEWLVHEPLDADLILHNGELVFEQIAALFDRADMVLSSPGFAIPLAQSVRTPVIAVFGGYEKGYSFSAGAAVSPTCLIEPLVGCDCFTHHHNCNKRIFMAKAKEKARDFASKKYDVSGLPDRFFNPGELQVFLDLIDEHKPKTIIEFGVHRGRNAAATLRNFKEVEKYVGIDVLPGYVTDRVCQRNEIPETAGDLALHDKRFRLILRERGSYELTESDLPKADFIFIDGDHSRRGVLNDFSLALSVANPGCVILFHDDNGLPAVQVSETLDELRKNGHVIDHIDGTWFAITRV